MDTLRDKIRKSVPSKTVMDLIQEEQRRMDLITELLVERESLAKLRVQELLVRNNELLQRCRDLEHLSLSKESETIEVLRKIICNKDLDLQQVAEKLKEQERETERLREIAIKRGNELTQVCAESSRHEDRANELEAKIASFKALLS